MDLPQKDRGQTWQVRSNGQHPPATQVTQQPTLHWPHATTAPRSAENSTHGEAAHGPDVHARTSATSLTASSPIQHTSARPPPNKGLPCRAATPLRTIEWQRELHTHPNKQWVQHLLQGLRFGFRIGYRGMRCFRLSRNLTSALIRPEVVTQYLETETNLGRTLGPFPDSPLPCLQCSLLGAIPKKSSDKWRLIMHLSYPDNSSINSGICRDDFSLLYSSVDDAIKNILHLGQGCYLAKFDIQSAFCLVPVHPDDWDLLGMHWEGQFYIDTVLPFGLRSAPFIFNKLATALEWILQCHGIEFLLHYLDDFLLVASTSALCGAQLRLARALCSLLGVPLADDKFDGPTTCIRFLGILLDTIAMEARLPQDKLERLTKMVDDWLARRTASKSDLQSLLGHLYAAAKVVPPGRTFTRRLVDHLKQAGAAEAIQLSEEALADLRWWQQYLGDWNGKSFFQEPFFTPAADIQLFTDASGTIGFGAYFNGNWLNGRWTPEQAKWTIAWKELYAIAIAAAAWAPFFQRKKNHVSLRQRNRGRRRLVRLFHRCCIDETNALSVFHLCRRQFLDAL